MKKKKESEPNFVKFHQCSNEDDDEQCKELTDVSCNWCMSYVCKEHMDLCRLCKTFVCFNEECCNYEHGICLGCENDIEGRRDISVSSTANFYAHRLVGASDFKTVRFLMYDSKSMCERDFSPEFDSQRSNRSFLELDG